MNFKEQRHVLQGVADKTPSVVLPAIDKTLEARMGRLDTARQLASLVKRIHSHVNAHAPQGVTFAEKLSLLAVSDSRMVILGMLGRLQLSGKAFTPQETADTIHRSYGVLRHWTQDLARLKTRRYLDDLITPIPEGEPLSKRRAMSLVLNPDYLDYHEEPVSHLSFIGTGNPPALPRVPCPGFSKEPAAEPWQLPEHLNIAERVWPRVVDLHLACGEFDLVNKA
jgi:hypothetical protein